jgi:hypothetical protein
MLKMPPLIPPSTENVPTLCWGYWFPFGFNCGGDAIDAVGVEGAVQKRAQREDRAVRDMWSHGSDCRFRRVCLIEGWEGRGRLQRG